MNINTSPDAISRSSANVTPGYMSGFGNSFETEALPGALPVGRNSPQVVAHGSVLANAAVVGLVALIGGLWGAGAGSFIGRKVPHIKPRPESLRHAVMFGVTIAVVTGVAMAVVVAMQLQHGGAWLILTLLLVLQPDVKRTWKKSIERVWGTTLGFAIALAIGLLVDDASGEVARAGTDPSGRFAVEPLGAGSYDVAIGSRTVRDPSVSVVARSHRVVADASRFKYERLLPS